MDCYRWGAGSIGVQDWCFTTKVDRIGTSSTVNRSGTASDADVGAVKCTTAAVVVDTVSVAVVGTVVVLVRGSNVLRLFRGCYDNGYRVVDDGCSSSVRLDKWRTTVSQVCGFWSGRLFRLIESQLAFLLFFVMRRSLSVYSETSGLRS